MMSPVTSLLVLAPASLVATASSLAPKTFFTIFLPSSTSTSLTDFAMPLLWCLSVLRQHLGALVVALRVRGEAAHESGEHLLDGRLGDVLVDPELLGDVADGDLVEQGIEISHGFLFHQVGLPPSPSPATQIRPGRRSASRVDPVDLTQNDIRGNAARRLRRARRLSATPLR